MPINRMNKRTGQKEWYGKITISGRVTTKKCSTRKAAMEWERLTRLEMESRTHSGTVSLVTLLNAYLDNVQTRFSDSSYRDKARIFKAAVSEFGTETDVTKITYRDIESWCNAIKRKISGVTANRYKIHMVAAWNWGIKTLGLPEPCPWRVQRYKEERRPRHIPSIDDFWKCHAVATTEEKAMLLCFLHLAARKNEVFGLKWEDVDWERNRIRVWTRKRDGGREFDLLPMRDELRAALLLQRFNTGLKGQYVFINDETGLPYAWHGKFLSRICKEAGVREFGYHAIRHLSACLLDEAGEPLAYIQAMLRHKSAATTSKYLHSLRGIQPTSSALFSEKSARLGAQILEGSTHEAANN